MNRILLILLILGTGLSSKSQKKLDNRINWPSEYDPIKSKFYVYNEIDIAAPPEKVWSILIAALEWPVWYKGAKDVKFEDNNIKSLNQNQVFFWKTMGLKLRTTVKEWEPNKILAWESRKKSIQGYHVWYLFPTETGTKVVTAEAQNGWLAGMEKVFQPKKLFKLHDIWLAELKKKAEEN